MHIYAHTYTHICIKHKQNQVNPFFGVLCLCDFMADHTVLTGRTLGNNNSSKNVSPSSQ